MSHGWIERWRRRFRAAVLAALLLTLGDIVYLATIWPDFAKLASGPAPHSSFMSAYEAERRADKTLPALRHKPLACDAAPAYVGRVFALAEDSRFWQHGGVDWEAIGEAILDNWRRERLTVGASSISQQTAKNLFLSPARTPLRKWHELVFTYALEHTLDKARILCLYLDVAELGPGVFGLEAAAQHYYGVGAAGLSLAQAVELAASLPSPRKHNPSTRTDVFMHRCAKIWRHVRAYL